MDDSSEVDHGYAWLTMICCMLMFILESSAYIVFGLVYLHMVEYYNTSKTVMSLVGGLQVMVYGLTGNNIT